MTAFDLDLFVLGGGSGGVRAARVAAAHGARVAIAEADRWGGTCVIRGCVPKKLLVYASAVSAQLADARGFGWQLDGVRFDWPTLIANKDREIERLSAGYRATLDRHGVAMLAGRAALADATTVIVADRRITARHVLIATGGVPRRPAIPGAELLLTSDDVFALPALPASLLVIGAGYIGLEMAHVFAGLGVQVSLVVHHELPLRGFDLDVRQAAAANLVARGITLHRSCEALGVTSVPGGGVRVELSDGAIVAADQALASVGRVPAIAGLGLEALGVALDPFGGILVDEWQATSVPGIHAVGDVTGRLALTPIAIREGHAFADTVFGGRPTPFVPDHVATAVFAQPPIATVGLAEHEARLRGPVEVFKTSFKPLRHGLSGRDERVLLKLVVDAVTRRVLGVHMVGDDAPEIVQAAAIAVTMGATKDDFDRTVALHPTAAEELVLLR